MSLASAELIIGVGSTEPTRGGGAGFACVGAGKEGGAGLAGAGSGNDLRR